MDRAEKVRIWRQNNLLTPEKLTLARELIQEIRAGPTVYDVLKRHPLADGSMISKAVLVAAYQKMVTDGSIIEDRDLLAKIRMKPVRTLSGVTTVTVLTKPYPCPGKCIFCPDDVRMPKSYLPDEPGAMRALDHNFDPYTQVRSRINALHALGHPTDKIELLILGGTWSSYKKDYQEWFIKRCFDAMNHNTDDEDVGAPDLVTAQTINENAKHRNVGLVIETRPDEIDPNELKRLRILGVTKVQVGVQSLDDRILDLNKRGHTVQTARRAVAFLRAAGFKVVVHWMPNLLGATTESDRKDFSRLWDLICPDELKIYPNQLLAGTELFSIWEKGGFTPYTTEELVHLIADVKLTVPRYCRINRVIRDIPSTNVVEGNKRTSLRQDAQLELTKRGKSCQCIRCREVRSTSVEPDKLTLDIIDYRIDATNEKFISFVTPDDKIAGFLRLSLPGENSVQSGMDELNGCALIREIHVYGQSLQVGSEKSGLAQHIGLGTQLLGYCEQIAAENGFGKVAVISAVGTRQYYLDRGFERGEFYLIKNI